MQSICCESDFLQTNTDYEYKCNYHDVDYHSTRYPNPTNTHCTFICVSVSVLTSPPVLRPCATQLLYIRHTSARDGM